MTVYKCHCGAIHDSATWIGCSPQIITLINLSGVSATSLTPDQVGQEIRRLLLGLRSPDHCPDSEYSGNYNTDALRRRALEVAGICWLAPKKMAPEYCCDWSPENPTGPAKVLASDQEERSMLWKALTQDGCAVPRVRRTYSTCARGTDGYISSTCLARPSIALLTHTRVEPVCILYGSRAFALQAHRFRFVCFGCLYWFFFVQATAPRISVRGTQLHLVRSNSHHSL